MKMGRFRPSKISFPLIWAPEIVSCCYFCNRVSGFHVKARSSANNASYIILGPRIQFFRPKLVRINFLDHRNTSDSKESIPPQCLRWSKCRVLPKKLIWRTSRKNKICAVPYAADKIIGSIGPSLV